MTDKQPEALRLADELDCRGMNRPSWKDQFDAGYELRRLHKENEAIRARLSQPNQFNPDWDAVAVMVEEQQRMAKELKAQREWQGLTDEEVFAALVEVDGNTKRLAPGFVAFYCAIEAKLKAKNA